MAVYTDNFNRADSGTLGANWTDIIAGFQIVSNQAKGLASNNYAYYSGGVTGADQYSQITYVAQTGINIFPQVCVRLSGTDLASIAGYYLFLNTDGVTVDKGWQLQRSSTFTTISTGTDTFSAGDIILLQIVGTTITFKKNGATIYSGTNSSHATGSPGIAVYAGANPGLIDNWEGGDVSASSTNIPYAGRQVGFYPGR